MKNYTWVAGLMSNTYLTNMLSDLPTTLLLTYTVAMVSNPSHTNIRDLEDIMVDVTINRK